MKATEIDLSKFDTREIIKLNTRVRKEFVKRNKEEYLGKCYKPGDAVKFHPKVEDGYRVKKFDFTRKVVGIIRKANVHRDGRIRRYHIDYYEKDSEEYTVRGTNQVEKADEEEARLCKFIHAVKNANK